MEIDGEGLLHLVRVGQEIFYELKINLVNKRLLKLVEELHQSMEGYIKYMKLIKVLCLGP